MQTENRDPPKIAYSIREACKASSLGRTTIYAHIAAGRLLARRIGGVTDAAEKAKPGRWYRPGFAQSTWRLVASISYSFGSTSAIARDSVLPLALTRAGYGAALFWGGRK